MSMITCPECKQPMSDFANSCPHCGYSENDLLKKLKECRTERVKLISNLIINPDKKVPFSLCQIVPKAAMARELYNFEFINKCSELNKIHFFGDYPSMPRLNSNGITMARPGDAQGFQIDEIIQLLYSGIVNIADKYAILGDDRGKYFQFDYFLKGLSHFLEEIVDIYSKTNVPAPFWVLIDLVGTKNTRLGSKLFYNSLFDDSAMVSEENISLPPIELTLDSLETDNVFKSVANAIWNSYGRKSFPIARLPEILGV